MGKLIMVRERVFLIQILWCWISPFLIPDRAGQKVLWDSADVYSDILWLLYFFMNKGGSRGPICSAVVENSSMEPELDDFWFLKLLWPLLTFICWFWHDFIYQISALLGNERFHDRATAEDAQWESPSLRNKMCIFTWLHCCVYTSLCERGWVMAAKQLEGFCLNSSSENSTAIIAFGKGDRGEEQQSVIHTQIFVAVSSTLSSRLFPHWLPSCLLYPQEATAAANNVSPFH